MVHLVTWRRACHAILAPLALVVAAHPLVTGAQQPRVTVFRNVSTVPMDSEQVLPGQSVVIRGDTIESAGPSGRTQVPAGALVIDGTGQYLMPGLTDMHVHLPNPSAPESQVEAELFLYVANGVTTARGMAGFDRHLRLRDRVRAGDLIGPTLFLAGPGLDGQRVKTPEEGEREVRRQRASGYDLVKVLPGLSLASFDAIVKTAREVGMPFGGHVPPDVGVRHVLQSGQETIEHLDGYLELLGGRSPLTSEAMAPIVSETTAAGVWNVPTMAVMAVNVGELTNQELTGRSELEYIGRAYIDEWLALRAKAGIPKPVSDVIQKNRLHLLKALNDRGARILLGTDSPQLFNAPGFSIRREVAMMGEAGLTPYQALRAGTQQTGLYFKRNCGTISPGACADLILLGGNPLQDLRNLGRQKGVMLRGRWLPQREIEDRLARIRNAPGNYRRHG
jgi:imidazolonepropionase-like amidohydrolase